MLLAAPSLASMPLLRIDDAGKRFVQAGIGFIYQHRIASSSSLMNGRLCATRAEAPGTPYLLPVTYKLVLQDRSSPAGQPCAECCQASELTPRKRALRDSRFPREEERRDEVRLGVRPFGLAGSVEARGLDEVGNGRGAVVVVWGADGGGG